MPAGLVDCPGCGRSCYPNQLQHSEHHGRKVCERCRNQSGGSTEMVTHGNSQAEKRARAKTAAWNNGRGWGI